MTTHDEEFLRKLRATFNIEAQEHLQAISTMLLELEKSPPAKSPQTVEKIYREAHSLKGAARAVDLRQIESICQLMESVFSTWKRQPADPPAETFDALHQAVDAITAMLATPGGTLGGDAQQQGSLIERLSRLQSGEAVIKPTEPLPVSQEPSPAPSSPPVDHERAVDTVRISIAALDARLLQAEDMLTVKSMTTSRAGELRTITRSLEPWQKMWARASTDARALRQAIEREGADTLGDSLAFAANVMNFLDWNADYIRSLELRLAALATQAEQDRHGVARRVDELLEDSKKLLMLPFSTLAASFPKLIRDICREQNKEADLVLHGGEVEIDKRVLEEMKDAMIHILRNCVDHGVETPAERKQLGKPQRATITIAVSRVNGDKVEILITDDGAGVDLDRVKESAVSHGVISAIDAQSLTEQDVLGLTFHSEVSVSPIVTAISGRGLGMAIVRSKAEKLGGRIAIESRRNVGTTLRIVLPQTKTTFRGILVSCADRVFVIPTVNVDRVLRARPKDVQTVENRETISLAGKVISLARLDAVLELPTNPLQRPTGAPLAVVVLHSGDQRIGFVVDHVLHEEEVLVKPLTRPLVRVRNVAGATVLGSGKAVPILNVDDLMRSAKRYAPSARLDPAERVTPLAKKILVVEDSITSRMLLKGILESAGYQVSIAVDGAAAYASARENRFDLIVSDVEMPRMTGFDLAAKIRSDKDLAELPIVLVTALESREERERGIDAGANAYIVKSSFDQSNLLEVIRRLI